MHKNIFTFIYNKNPSSESRLPVIICEESFKHKTQNLPATISVNSVEGWAAEPGYWKVCQKKQKTALSTGQVP